MSPISNGNTMTMPSEQFGIVRDEIREQDDAEFERLAAQFADEVSRQETALVGEPVTGADLSSSKETYAAAQQEIARQQESIALQQLRNRGDRLELLRSRKPTA